MLVVVFVMFELPCHRVCCNFVTAHARQYCCVSHLGSVVAAPAIRQPRLNTDAQGLAWDSVTWRQLRPNNYARLT